METFVPHDEAIWSYKGITTHIYFKIIDEFIYTFILFTQRLPSQLKLKYKINVFFKSLKTTDRKESQDLILSENLFHHRNL